MTNIVLSQITEGIRSEILLEALPYIREFYNKIIVIKYGGAAMKEPHLRESFAKDVVLLKYVGIHPVIIHGGGPQINFYLQKIGLPIEFIDGQRVTDKPTMEVVEMVLSGLINKEIVSLIQKFGKKAVGISGKDGNLAIATPISLKKQKENGEWEELPFQHVGTIKKIHPEIIFDLITRDYIPVIASVSLDEKGNTMNINADIMAGEIAKALQSEKLILLTDTPGILDKERNVITQITPEEIQNLIEEKIIQGGMIPKVNCCISCVKHGVRKAHIIDGRIPHSLLIELFSNKGIGTMIKESN